MVYASPPLSSTSKVNQRSRSGVLRVFVRGGKSKQWQSHLGGPSRMGENECNTCFHFYGNTTKSTGAILQLRWQLIGSHLRVGKLYVEARVAILGGHFESEIPFFLGHKLFYGTVGVNLLLHLRKWIGKKYFPIHRTTFLWWTMATVSSREGCTSLLALIKVNMASEQS